MNEDVELEAAEGIEVDLPEEKEDPKAKVAKKEDISVSERQEENEELDGADSDEEREAIRSRRREERKRKKQAVRERDVAKERLISSLQMQVNDLSEKLSNIDRKQSGTDVARLEEELNQAISTANEAREHLKNAATAQDGEGVAEATELYYTARRRAEYLSGVKQQISKKAQNPAPQLDSRIVDMASNWMRSNKWYNHSGDDVDSVTAKAVDNQLAREGYDPRTKEYWEELNDRLEDKLPHRFGKATQRGKTGNSAPVGGSDKDSLSIGGKGGGTKFILSAARVKALQDAGIWDDEAARTKMITKYRDYDRQKKDQA